MEGRHCFERDNTRREGAGHRGGHYTGTAKMAAECQSQALNSYLFTTIKTSQQTHFGFWLSFLLPSFLSPISVKKL